MITYSGTRVNDGLWSTTDIARTSLPVGNTAGNYRVLSRIAIPVRAGDQLDVCARAHVSSPHKFNVGVGSHLWGYDVDLPEPPKLTVSQRPWWALGTSDSDQVDWDRHHMPLRCSAVYEVPADWPDGHRMMVVYQGDAYASNAAPGDTIVVDPMGLLIVRRWTAPEPAAEEAPCV